MSLLKDAEKTKVIVGDGYVIQNPLTGSWFAYLNSKARPWVCEERNEAIDIIKKAHEKEIRQRKS
jgi:hypothetical protein